jgi:hypothetical protein
MFAEQVSSNQLRPRATNNFVIIIKMFHIHLFMGVVGWGGVGVMVRERPTFLTKSLKLTVYFYSLQYGELTNNGINFAGQTRKLPRTIMN